MNRLEYTNPKNIDLIIYKCNGNYLICFNGFKHGSKNAFYATKSKFSTISEALEVADTIAAAKYTA